jgi:purine-binding chemotaxis protein CheW
METHSSTLRGRYLTFKLGAELYGLPILKVQEIISLMKITRLPKMPSFMLGCVNLRGRIVPVVGLRQKFGLPTTQETDRTCIVVVQVPIQEKLVTLGVLVDEVCEVLNLSEEQLCPAPALGASIDTSFILAMGKLGDSVVMLLDLDKAFSEGEFAELKKLEV